MTSSDFVKRVSSSLEQEHLETKRLPLNGIRVVDMGIVLAGPFAAMMLADMGAEVIRIESPKFAPYATRGMVVRPSPLLLRTAGPITGGYPNREAGERPWNRASLFNVHARNKLSMTADITKPEGLAIARKLLQRSDIFLENNAYGVVERLGLGYDTLKELKPDIIMISMPGFGNRGPYKNFVALGRLLEAVSGHTLLRGYRNLDPTLTTDVYHADASSGAIAVFAAMIALHYRRRTGKGQFIDLAQIETMIPHMGEAIMDYTMNGRVQQSIGNRHAWAAPCGVYRCSGVDRWIAITVCSDDQWQGLGRALGSPNWAGQERFADALGRRQNHDELDQLISACTVERTDREMMQLLQREGVPAGPVMDERDCYNDPHLKARGFFEAVTHAECGTHLYPGPLWKLSKTPAHIRKPPCRLGEHNEYVYKELLGVSEEEYAELTRLGHIATDYDERITVRGKAEG